MNHTLLLLFIVIPISIVGALILRRALDKLFRQFPQHLMPRPQNAELTIQDVTAQAAVARLHKGHDDQDW